LKVIDDEGGITGQVENWSLILTYPPETCAESAGTVVFEDDVYGCLADELMIKVQDADLLGSGTVNVAVWSDNEVTPESLTLTENPPSSGTFKGSILTTNSAPVNGDGKVSTTGGKVYVEYIDADDGSGGTNVSRTDDADIDCIGPVISNVTAINITGSTATITFNTDTISVYYGLLRNNHSSIFKCIRFDPCYISFAHNYRAFFLLHLLFLMLNQEMSF